MFFHIIPKSRTIWCLCKYVFPVCVLVLCVTLPSVPVLVPSGVVVLVVEVGFRACRYLSCLHRHGPLVENPRGVVAVLPLRGISLCFPRVGRRRAEACVLSTCVGVLGAVEASLDAARILTACGGLLLLSLLPPRRRGVWSTLRCSSVRQPEGGVRSSLGTSVL